MSDGLKDILSNLNKEIEQEKLIQYLNRHLTDEDQHAVEKVMNEDDFVNDAVEGLQSMENKENISMHVHLLNENLKKQLSKKYRKRKKRKMEEQPWIYYSIVIILVLIVIAWLVIKKLG